MGEKKTLYGDDAVLINVELEDHLDECIAVKVREGGLAERAELVAGQRAAVVIVEPEESIEERMRRSNDLRTFRGHTTVVSTPIYATKYSFAASFRNQQFYIYASTYFCTAQTSTSQLNLGKEVGIVC